MCVVSATSLLRKRVCPTIKSEHNNSNKENNKAHIKNSYTHIPTHRRQATPASPFFYPLPPPPPSAASPALAPRSAGRTPPAHPRVSAKAALAA